MISLAVVALAPVGLDYWTWKMIIEAERTLTASTDKGHDTLNKHLDEIKVDLRDLKKEVGQLNHRLSRIVANTAEDLRLQRRRRSEVTLQEEIDPNSSPEALAQERELLVLLSFQHSPSSHLQNKLASLQQSCTSDSYHCCAPPMHDQYRPEFPSRRN